MSDENTNQDVTTPSNTDGNYHSFADLEQSVSTKSDSEVMKEATALVKEEKAPTKEVRQPEKEVEAKRELSTNTKEENAEEQSESIEKEMIAEIKKLEAKFGDERLEIPQDAILKVTVDGKEEEITLNELRNQYSGKVAWDKKFGELSKEKKSFIEDKQMVEKYVNNFAELVNKGDRAGAMEYLASLSGQNPLEFRKELRNQIMKEHQQILSMSEEQKRAYELKEENDFLKRQQESAYTTSEDQKLVSSLQNQISEYQEAHKVSDAELLAAYEDLNEAGSTVSLEAMQTYVNTVRSYNKTEEALKTVTAMENLNDSIMEEMTTVALDNPEFDNADIIEIFSEAYPELVNGAKKKPVAKKAVESAKASKEEGTYSERLAKNKVDSFYSFDDL